MKHASIHLPIQQIFIEHLQVTDTECTDFRHTKKNENTSVLKKITEGRQI